MSLSGGKDSTAAAFTANAILDAAEHPRSRRIAVRANIGTAEWRETPATAEVIASATGRALAPCAKGLGLEPALLTDEALERFFQKQPNLALVDRLRTERELRANSF
ncbi:MAG: hypothetical protein ACRYG4_09030 [Janthinobacterium lividum]